MRVTVTVDDELYRKVLGFVEPDMDKSQVFREAMEVFVRVQAAKRLAAGGSAPGLKSVPRRRPASI